jgi:hypothetical protein
MTPHCPVCNSDPCTCKATPSPTGETLEQAHERVCRESWDREQKLQRELTETKAKLAEVDIMYQSACSGLWYKNSEAAGSVCAIKIGARVFLAQDHAQLLTLQSQCAKQREALEEIKKYGAEHDGCCPYGCDTPTIAETALSAKPDLLLLERVVKVLKTATTYDIETSCAQKEIDQLLKELQPLVNEKPNPGDAMRHQDSITL